MEADCFYEKRILVHVELKCAWYANETLIYQSEYIIGSINQCLVNVQIHDILTAQKSDHDGRAFG